MITFVPFFLIHELVLTTVVPIVGMWRFVMGISCIYRCQSIALLVECMLH